MQFTMVSDVPLAISGTFCATKVENKGESAITTIPQMNKKAISAGTDGLNKKNGESKQHRHDDNKARVAILFAPKYCESRPLATQAIAPQAIIKKDKRETFKLLW